MTQYPIWMQSDITAASGPEGWQERREKTLAALEKIKDMARTDPIAEAVYGLAVQLALIDDEAAETRHKLNVLDHRAHFIKNRVDLLWEDVWEMRNGIPDEKDALERLAALEHEQWAHWTAYFLANLTPENIERWKRQVETPYAELSEKEKESDREWARKVLEIAAHRDEKNEGALHPRRSK